MGCIFRTLSDWFCERLSRCQAGLKTCVSKCATVPRQARWMTVSARLTPPPSRCWSRTKSGLYEVRDADDHELHGPDNFFAAALHALPDAEREALGYQINQWETLKQSVLRSPLSHDRFRSILADNPLRKPKYDPETMKLRGGMQGFSQNLRRVGGTPDRARTAPVASPRLERNRHSNLSGAQRQREHTRGASGGSLKPSSINSTAAFDAGWIHPSTRSA